MTDLESMGNAVRYGLTVLMMITVPPGLLYWVVVHTLAGRLRRFGPAPTLAVLLPVLLACCFGLFLIRGRLVGADLGWSPLLFAIGVVVYAISLRIELRVREQMTVRILEGLSELAGESERLLTEGIYAELRHPRYLALVLRLLAFALAVNYAGLYALLVLSSAALVVIVQLEERELAQRFGQAWVDYRSSVPALVPRNPRTLLRSVRAPGAGGGP